MDYPHGHHRPHSGRDRREEEEEEEEYHHARPHAPPFHGGDQPPPPFYNEPPPPFFGGDQPPPPFYNEPPPPLYGGNDPPPPFYGGNEPPPPSYGGSSHAPPQGHHTSHAGPDSYRPTPPHSVDDYSPPPPPAVEKQHHPHMPHFPSHHNEEEKVANKPTVRVYSKAETNYSLTIRDGHVVLARSDPSDPFQHWIKDEKLSTKVKDEEGYPSFALVNKATGQAMKHSIGATHPVQLIPYNPNALDESILWTDKDLGDGYRVIRMVNNIKLNVDALNGDKNHGGVHDGTKIVLWEWKKGDNQRWKIVPYCKSLQHLI